MTAFDTFHPTRTDLCAIDVHDLLPQQEPFVMVGRLIGFDDRTTVTETVVAEDNLFVDGGEMSATGLMENIAQTCAVRIGYVNKYILKKGIQIGFIGAVRNMEILRLPRVDEVLVTRVVVREEVFGMTLADATVSSDGEVLVTTEMKIAVREDGVQ